MDEAATVPAAPPNGLTTLVDIVTSPRSGFVTLAEFPTWGWAYLIAAAFMLVGGYLMTEAFGHAFAAYLPALLAKDPSTANLAPDTLQKIINQQVAFSKWLWLLNPIGLLIANTGWTLVMLVANAIAKGKGTFKTLWAMSMNACAVTFGLSSLVLGLIVMVRGPADFNGIWFVILSAIGLMVVARLPKVTAYTLAAPLCGRADAAATFVKQHALEFPSITGLLQNQETKSANTSGTLAQYGVRQQSLFSQNLAQVGSQYTIYNGSLNQLLAQQARRQVEASRADFLRSKQQLALDVATAFFGLAARREAVRLTTADLVYQRALVEVARRSEAVGRVAGVDVLRAQVGATKSEANLLSAQADEANAREALALQIGAPFDTAFAVPATLPEPAIPQTPIDQLLTVADANRPDIIAAQFALFAARLARGTIDTDRLPQFTLNGAFGNQTVPTAFGPNSAAAQAQNAALVASGKPALPLPVRGGPGFWQIGATASYALPLVDYGTRHANHRAADLQIASAERALETARIA